MTDDDNGPATQFATLQAACALRGFELIALPGGGHVVRRWNLFRELATLAEVEAFLRRVGPLRFPERGDEEESI